MLAINLGASATISTGGADRVVVSESSVTNWVNQVFQINANATSPPSNAGNINNKQMFTLKSTDEAGAKFIGLSFQHVLSSGERSFALYWPAR